MNPSRRTLLRDGSLVLFGAGLVASSLATALADDTKRRVRIGMVTDLHYADKPPAGSRHYRETLAKLEEAAEQFQKNNPDFVVELGDLIDAADSVDAEKRYLATINKEFAALPGDKHYAFGSVDRFGHLALLSMFSRYGLKNTAKTRFRKPSHGGL